MRLARFSLHFARNRMTPYVANVHCNHFTSTYSFSLVEAIVSFSATLSLSLPLFGAGILREKKRVRVTGHDCELLPHVSTCIIHVQLAESRPEGQCLVSNK